MEAECSGAVRRALDEVRQVQSIIRYSEEAKRREEHGSNSGKTEKMHGITQMGSGSIKEALLGTSQSDKDEAWAVSAVLEHVRWRITDMDVPWWFDVWR